MAPADLVGTARLRTTTTSQERFVSWVVDVLVYVVVLNLFIEYVPTVITESFTISILTALLIKLLLVVIAGIEHRMAAWFRGREGSLWRVLGLASAFGVLFLSKFVILEAVDVVFGDRVELGGFLEIVTLILAMILARVVVDLAFQRLGRQAAMDR
jgi:hypothetical protein